MQRDSLQQEFHFINLCELIKNQLEQSVEALHSSFSVVQRAAAANESQASLLVEENKKLCKRLSAAGLLHGGREPAAGVGEPASSHVAPDSCGPLFSSEVSRNEVIPLGSGAGQKPPPPNSVEARGPSEPIPTMRLDTRKTEKTAWEDDSVRTGATGGSKAQDLRAGLLSRASQEQRHEGCEECSNIWGAYHCLHCGRRRDSNKVEDDEEESAKHGQTKLVYVGGSNKDTEVLDVVDAEALDILPTAISVTPVMPLKDQDLAPVSMATDLDLEDVQDTLMPPESRRLSNLSIEARASQEVSSSRPPSRSIEDRLQSDAMTQATTFHADPISCVRCGNIFMADAAFCRKCGCKRKASLDTRNSSSRLEPVAGSQESPKNAMSRISHERSSKTGHQETHRSKKAATFDESFQKVNSMPSKKSDGEDIVPAMPGKARDSAMSMKSVPSSKRAFASEYGTAGTKRGTVEDSTSFSGASAIVEFPQLLHNTTNDIASKHKFEVLTVWKADRKQKCTKIQPNGLSTKIRKSEVSLAKDSEATTESKGLFQQRDFRDEGTKRCHIINPNNPRRGLWDVVSLMLVIYDMFVIPFDFFDPPPTPFSVFMVWWSRIFWTIDMPMSFFTGFVTTDGFIELRPKKIARRYLGSWFSLDVAIVSVDWLELVMSANKSVGALRMGKASRTFRIIRMLRLLRLARMREVLTLITERINSDKVVIIADILKTMTIILGLAHMIACLWYAVGGASDEGSSWVDKAGYTRNPIADRYFISLHWSIAQFAGGMDEVTPGNSNERIFAIGMFILAFIVASVFVSSITSSMTQLNIIGSHQSQQISTLRRYLHQNGISNKLAVRIQRNAQHALTEQLRTLPEGSVTLLSLVSEPLRVEIHLEMYAPILNVHPFFAKYIEECPQVMRKVCHIATCVMMVSVGDVIFCAGEIPSQPKMYIISSGQLEYETSNENKIPIGEDQWVSEATLWVEWMHRGSFSATSDCRLCVLDAKTFQHICSQFSHSNFDPQSYARDFVKTLNQEGSDASDLPFDFDPDCVKKSSPSSRGVGGDSGTWRFTGFFKKGKLGKKRTKALNL